MSKEKNLEPQETDMAVASFSHPIYVDCYKSSNVMVEDRFCLETNPDGSVRKISTVSMLMNAEKYENLFGSSRLTQLATVLSKPASGTPISQLKDGMSDSEILDSVKSKHIQGINDMTNYMKAVNADAEALGSDFKSRVESIAAQKAAQQQAAPQSSNSTSE